jgi:hypothetical protein
MARDSFGDEIEAVGIFVMDISSAAKPGQHFSNRFQFRRYVNLYCRHIQTEPEQE